jgi:hypothetical protein
MAEIQVRLYVSKRWYFWPALVLILILGRLRLIRDPNTAGKWLANHAMRIEVR